MANSKVSQYAGMAFPAGSTSLAQFQFVVINSSGQIVTPSTSGVFALVLWEAGSLATETLSNGLPSGGYVVGSYYDCVSPFMSWPKVITGANLTVGQAVMTDANGHAIPQSGSGITLGYAIAASNSGAVATLSPA